MNLKIQITSLSELTLRARKGTASTIQSGQGLHVFEIFRNELSPAVRKNQKCRFDFLGKSQSGVIRDVFDGPEMVKVLIAS